MFPRLHRLALRFGLVLMLAGLLGPAMPAQAQEPGAPVALYVGPKNAPVVVAARVRRVRPADSGRPSRPRLRLVVRPRIDAPDPPIALFLRHRALLR